MKTKNVYLTNTRFGIDTNVLLLLLFISILSLGLMAFKLSEKKVCAPFSIISSSIIAGNKTIFFMGDPVIFKAEGSDIDDITWDFGDNTPIVAGNNVQHIYTGNAKYTVTANLNSTCSQAMNITVNPLLVNNPLLVPGNPVTGPESAVAGNPVAFMCNVKATQYSWSILNSPIFAPQPNETASFNFPIAGNYIIELILDADPSKVYRKQITILPPKEEPVKLPKQIPVIVKVPPVVADHKAVAAQEKPEEKKPEEKKEEPVVVKPKDKLFIPDEMFRIKFEEVVRGESTSQAFDDFLCDGGATKVLITSDNNRWETVASICQQFYKNKKIKKIWDVTTDRNDSKCIILIHLKYKKGGFL